MGTKALSHLTLVLPVDKLHVTGVSGSSPLSLLPPGSFLMKLMRWAYFEVSQRKDPSVDLDPPVRAGGWGGQSAHTTQQLHPAH